MLAVNVASRCGYTPQYAGLRVCTRSSTVKGSRSSGFRATSSAGRSRAPTQEIKEFCSTRYDVTFPLLGQARGERPRPAPALRVADLGPATAMPGDIQWNFEKFLIGRDGHVIGRYPSGTKPEDNGLRTDIAEAL